MHYSLSRYHHYYHSLHYCDRVKEVEKVQVEELAKREETTRLECLISCEIIFNLFALLFYSLLVVVSLFTINY